MAVTNRPIFPQTPKNAAITLVNADGTTTKTLLTAGTDGAKIKAIYVCSDDTTDRYVALYIRVSAADYLIGRTLVKAGAGTGSYPNIQLLNDIWGCEEGLNIEASGVVKVAALSAVTALKFIYVTAEYGDY